MARSRPFPVGSFVGRGGSEFLFDRSSDLLLVSVEDGGEAAVPADDFLDFVAAVVPWGTGEGVAAGAIEALASQPETAWEGIVEGWEEPVRRAAAEAAAVRARCVVFASPGRAARLAHLGLCLVGGTGTGEAEEAPRVIEDPLAQRAVGALGNAHRHRGDLEAAGLAFAETLGPCPRAPEVAFLEALLAFHRGRGMLAREWVEEAVEGFSGEAPGRLAAPLLVGAALAVRSGDLPAAAGWLEGELAGRAAGASAVEGWLVRLAREAVVARDEAAIRETLALPAPGTAPARDLVAADLMEAVGVLRVALAGFDGSRRLLRALAVGRFGSAAGAA
jgi:hypothetical protein